MRFSGLLNHVLAAIVVGIVFLMAARQFEKLIEYERISRDTAILQKIR